MNKPIINISELAYEPFPAPMPEEVKRKFEGAKLGFVSHKIGAKKLGYNVIVVPPGKRAFPFHNHRVNEEMFFVLEGEGEVRIGDKTYPIKKGDFMAHPPGGPETAHQILNTSEKELRYLGVSTQESPEIAEYLDSKKFGVLHMEGRNPDGSPIGLMRFLGHFTDSLKYWDGE
jgi:uncharacterized cupin superfamily protein